MRTYCEFVATSTTTIGSPTVGLVELAASLATPLGIQSSSIGYYPNGDIKNNNTTVGTGSTWGLNDVIGMIFDDILGTIEFLKNNTASYTYTGVGNGWWYPAAVLGQYDTVTGHFSEADWVYTPTSSYSWSNYYYLNPSETFDPSVSWDTANTSGSVAVVYQTQAEVSSLNGAIAGQYERSAGKYFFNIVPGAAGIDTRFGVMFGNNLSLYPGDDANAVVMRFNGANGEVWHDNAVQAYMYYSGSDPFDIYVDFSAGTIEFYHFSGTSWVHNFTPGTPVRPIFAGVEYDWCVLHCSPATLDGNQLDATKTDYLPWFDGL
jgi:hypothetical protein